MNRCGFLLHWHRAQPSSASGGTGALPRWLRILWHGPYGQLLWGTRRAFLHGVWEKWGRFLWKDMGNHPQKKGLADYIKPGPNCWLLCYDNTLCEKKTLMPGVFFSGMFWRFCPAETSSFWAFPQKIHGSPGSKCYAEKQKKEEHGMGFKSSGRLLLLVPWQPPGASKMSRHFGGLFPITNELLSANKQQTKTIKNPSFGCKWWISGKPRKVSSIMGVIQQLPRFTRVYTDLRTSQKYGSSLRSRRCMVNFLDDLSVISS